MAAPRPTGEEQPTPRPPPRWRIKMTHRPIATALLATALLATLGACGQREDLKPVADQAPPVTPVGATRPPTNEELTTPDAPDTPARTADLLIRPEQPEPHESDLPPPGGTRKPGVSFS